MSKSIFISSVHEDNHRVRSIKKWAKNNRLGDVVITHEVEDKRTEGYNAIKKHILNKIKGASIIIVVIGEDTHNHDWIRVEVELANNFNKTVICLRAPATQGGVPPILNNYEPLNFDPDTLLNAINNT